jgi:opacity protein-like surface antigen
MRQGLAISLLLSTLLFSSLTYAASPYYIAADGGIFRGNFNNNFIDQTDAIPQNITEDATQYGYTGGIALGYSKLCNERYSLGAEISGNLDSHHSLYQAGASTAAFSDMIQIKNHFDLTFVPGIMLGSTVLGYAKLGVSYAALQDKLTSPVGFTPTYTNYNSNRNAFGFAGGLGVKKFITDHVSVFTEADYHDYGTVNFSGFQNFSANYTHSAHVYSVAFLLGAAYQF